MNEDTVIAGNSAYAEHTAVTVLFVKILQNWLHK